MRPPHKPNRNGFSRRHSPSLAVLALLAVLAGAAAARQEEGQLRAVRGTVVGAANEPLANAVVYLKNSTTLAVRTYISSGNGQYRFSGLDPNTEYKIYAEHGELTSATHTISSFNSRREIVMDLKVDRKKSEK